MSRSGLFSFALRVTALAVSCAFHGGPIYGQADWPAYRHDKFRTGVQPEPTALADPSSVSKGLMRQWTFTPEEGGQFIASPIVVNDTVFIGSSNGFFYALDAASGALLWQYPEKGQLGLTGSCGSAINRWAIGNYGIQSSAAFARIQGRDAVVFGAPDPTVDAPALDMPGPGSARLFALDAQRAPLIIRLIWKSDVVARVTTSCTTSGPGIFSELHERIARSSPLIEGLRIYVGVHDGNGDHPVQSGKVVAVNLNSGRILPTFCFRSTIGRAFIPRSPIDDDFVPGAGLRVFPDVLENCSSTGTRGGGVWNSPASDGEGVYFTTGNTRENRDDAPREPRVNHGLSMIKVDPATGAVKWKLQPVPFALDKDPDWAAGAAVMRTQSCGELIVSVMKDGWSYAVNAADRLDAMGKVVVPAGTCLWQFPPTGHDKCIFPKDDMYAHGDDKYIQPAAVWGDVVVIKTGGHALIFNNPGDGVGAGYSRLHALNA
jgi:outer membrane protein assembly factor BamB